MKQKKKLDTMGMHALVEALEVQEKEDSRMKAIATVTIDEAFVVVSKTVDKECDYEAAIKGAQEVRIAQFTSAFNKANLRQVV